MPLLAILLSLSGIAGFIFLFVRNFNIYWLILSPVIFVVYQFPAFVVFWLYKKKRARRAAIAETDPPEEGEQVGSAGPSGEKKS